MREPLLAQGTSKYRYSPELNDVVKHFGNGTEHHYIHSYGSGEVREGIVRDNAPNLLDVATPLIVYARAAVGSSTRPSDHHSPRRTAQAAHPLWSTFTSLIFCPLERLEN